jgi:hypothetical protein
MAARLKSGRVRARGAVLLSSFLCRRGNYE